MCLINRRDCCPPITFSHLLSCAGIGHKAQTSGQCLGLIESADICVQAAQRLKNQTKGEWLHEGKATLNRQRVVIAWGEFSSACHIQCMMSTDCNIIMLA